MFRPQHNHPSDLGVIFAQSEAIYMEGTFLPIDDSESPLFWKRMSHSAKSDPLKTTGPLGIPGISTTSRQTYKPTEGWMLHLWICDYLQSSTDLLFFFLSSNRSQTADRPATEHVRHRIPERVYSDTHLSHSLSRPNDLASCEPQTPPPPCFLSVYPNLASRHPRPPPNPTPSSPLQDFK